MQTISLCCVQSLSEIRQKMLHNLFPGRASNLCCHCLQWPAWICVISPKWEWPVIKVLRFPLHVIALTISMVRCFLTAGCAVTCAHQAFLCLLGCLLSTLMAIGGWVQASPDHCSQSWVSGTDRRNRNHINPARTKRKAYILLHIHSKQKQENLAVCPLHQQHVSLRLIVVYWCFKKAVCHPHLLPEGCRRAPCEDATGLKM